MRKILLLSGFLTMVLLIYSCKYNSETLKPRISGLSGEIILVIPQNKWESAMGDTLRKLFSYDQPALPQPEPIFDIIQIPPNKFSKIFSTHRNIVNIKIDSKYTEPGISMANDQWAVPQLVINVTAPNDSVCINMLIENSDLIIDKINDAERQRVLYSYKKYQETDISRKLKKKYHLRLYIPKGYTMDVDSADFVWLSSETPLSSQGIFIYFYPYNDRNVFLPENLIRKRNEVLKKHVNGPVENTWMTTEDLITPVYTEFEKDSLYFAKLQGLWKLQNGFMGGPFVSISTVDEERNRVVTLEGFVYAPNDDKREFLRQVESILYSVEILD